MNFPPTNFLQSIDSAFTQCEENQLELTDSF